MKLINPTDDQLNEAFAEKVCGWVWTKLHDARYVKGDLVEPELFVWCLPNGHFAANPWQHKFCSDANAILPWMEKSPFDVQITYSNTCMVWTVTLQGRFTSNREYRGEANGADGEQPPRAAVIALLRAHGVEIEISQ